MNQTISDKIIVLGIDGMDPRLTAKYVKEGKMPNTKRFIEAGAQREDLVLLGGHPTVTPPMWTTLATGAYSVTHGITCFSRQGETLDRTGYNLDSRLCKAEQLWNVFAEAGKKTLVWHWPGSSWPPTSDSPDLHVVDGTQPAAVNILNATIDKEFILVADKKTEEVMFKPKAASDSNVPCVIADVQEVKGRTTGEQGAADKVALLLERSDGEHALSSTPFDIVLSPIKEATDWASAPKEAKEFTLLFTKGLNRRVGLILKNEQGVYDHIAVYKSKKDETPLFVLQNDVFTPNIVMEYHLEDRVVTANRSMRILELDQDNGEHIKLWISSAMDIHSDEVWHPKSLYQKVVENAGYCQPFSMVGGSDAKLIVDCMGENWSVSAKWQAKALNYLIKEEKYEMVFSHFHNIDLQGHMIIRHLKDQGDNKLPESAYLDFLERMYVQTDNYLGEFLHLLDEGWTVFIVSDHAAVCPEHVPPMIGDQTGVNVRVMEELGFTAVKKDQNGKDLYEIDWEKTKAVAVRGNHIYINVKGRDKYGIVEPEDQYEVEEEVMTGLYGYHDPHTGKRVIALALRNKDAVLLGMGGPESGDIIYWNAEGYNYDHCDSLSTTYGCHDTSVSPIFIAAGKGLKKGFTTDRIIRQVDVAPTIAVLGGVRMPAQCEGAPVYQIFEQVF